MKICWDTIEGIYLSNRGNLRKNGSVCIEMDSCVYCGDFYLTYKHNPSEFCSISCSSYNRICNYVKSKQGKNNPFYGKKHSDYIKSDLSRMASKRVGKLNGNYKGGYWKKNIPLYDTYASKLIPVEEVQRSNEDKNILQVKCAYCGGWFVPLRQTVSDRLKKINTINPRGELRFYCSDGCKKACPIFHKQKCPKGFKKATSREVQPELRQMVLKRDNYTCQYGDCGKTIEDVELHCHHLEGINLNPIESADMDMCIIFCKDHHKLVHKQKDCRYFELQCRGEIKHE